MIKTRDCAKVKKKWGIIAEIFLAFLIYMIVHVLNTFVSLCMVYAHFCAQLCTHMCGSQRLTLNASISHHIMLLDRVSPWALRPLIQQEYLSSVFQGFSHLCLSSPGIAGKYHQPKYFIQMLQMNNKSLLVWRANTSWLESFAQPPFTAS